MILNRNGLSVGVVQLCIGGSRVLSNQTASGKKLLHCGTSLKHTDFYEFIFFVCMLFTLCIFLYFNCTLESVIKVLIDNIIHTHF